MANAVRDVGRWCAEGWENINTSGDQLRAGAVSTAVSISLLFPLDTRKTLLQSTSSFNTRALDATISTVPTSRYSGLGASLVAQLPGSVLTFSAFEVAINALRKRVENLKRPFGRKDLIYAACIGDVVGALWSAPFESIKQKVQVGLVPNLASGLRSTLSQGGIFGLYQGIGGMIVRDVSYRAVNLVILDELRKRLARRFERDLRLRESIVLSVGVAALSAAVTVPLDVAKTRLMTQRIGDGQLNRWFGGALAHSMQTEGNMSLYRGLGPRVLYAAGTSLLFLSVYDRVSRTLSKSELKAPKGTFSRSAFVPLPRITGPTIGSKSATSKALRTSNGRLAVRLH